MAEYRLDRLVEGELWEIWAYIAQDDPDAATRVVEAAYATFAVLAANPRIGKARRFSRSRLQGVRSFGVQGFPN